jgi:hypothetical protein
LIQKYFGLYFLGFSGHESSCQFDFQPFLATTPSLQFQVENVNSLLIFMFQKLSNGILGAQFGYFISCTFVPKIMDFIRIQFPKWKIHLGMLGHIFPHL